MNAEKLPKMDSLEEAAMLLRKLQSDPKVRALAFAQELYDHDMATMKSEGRTEGCNENSRAVAAKMLADDEPLEKIMRYCDLPEEEILLIREKGSEYNHK